jgi:hypothetical protein
LASLSLLLAWLASILLGDQLPIDLEFSIWAPKSLFSTPLLFILDEISWPLFLTSIAISLVLSLTLPSRDLMISVRERLTSIIYLCLSLGAILAGNMLSVVTIWMSMDLFIFTLCVRNTHQEKDGAEIVKWFAKNLISIFILLIAIVLNISKGGSLHFREPMIAFSVILVIFSSLLRLPFLSISGYGAQIRWLDGGNLSVLDIFPALAGFAVLGHVIPGGIPSGAILWVRVIGASCLIYSLIHSFFSRGKKEPVIVLYLGLFGLGILASSYGSNEAGIMISATGVMIASLHLILKDLPIHESWHTVIPILFIGMLAGMPGTPGGLLGLKTVDEIINLGVYGIALLVWIGMSTLSGGYLNRTNLTPRDWKNSENLTKISYALGMLFLVVNTFFVGTKLNHEVVLKGLFYFLSVAAAGGLVYYGLTKVSHVWANQLLDRIRIPPMESIFDTLRTIGDFSFGILYGVGRIFESETGMLWAFVILQLLILALWNFGI